MERAAPTARLLDVGYRMSLFPNPRGYNNEWESVLSASGAIDSYKLKYKDIKLGCAHWNGEVIKNQIPKSKFCNINFL